MKRIKSIPINHKLMVPIKNFVHNFDTYGPIGSFVKHGKEDSDRRAILKMPSGCENKAQMLKTLERLQNVNYSRRNK